MEDVLPQRRPGVVVEEPNGAHCVVHNPDSREYFRIGVREAGFYHSLDGSRDKAELATKNEQGYSPAQVEALLDWFQSKGLLGVEPTGAQSSRTAWYLHPWRIITRPDLFRFHLFNPDRLLEGHRRFVDFFFSRGALAGYLLILLSPLLLYAARPQLAISAAVRMGSMTFALWLGLYASILLMNLLHEGAHAITCKHFGGRVEKIGLMFMFLNPVIYCDVSDSWRLRRRTHKLMVMIAGIFSQLLLTCLGIDLWLLTGSVLVLNFVVLNSVIAIFNLFPFVRLDGYWLLVHLLDEPNLRTKGMRAVEGGIRRVFRRQPARSVEGSRPLVTLWGVGHIVAVPAFWLLGLYMVYHRVSHISPRAAVLIALIFGAGLLYRLVKGAILLSGALYRQEPAIPA